MDTPRVKIEGIFSLEELYAGFALTGLIAQWSKRAASPEETLKVTEDAGYLGEAMVREMHKRQRNNEERRKQMTMDFINSKERDCDESFR